MLFRKIRSPTCKIKTFFFSLLLGKVYIMTWHWKIKLILNKKY